MKKLITILMLLNIFLYAGFFNETEKLALAQEQEREHFCTIFTQKAIAYEKTMRNDELAYITLESYKKRANIYCSKEEQKQNNVVKAEKSTVKVPHYIKNISLEDDRLCKIFQYKVENYEKNMRDDSLASTTLDSYKRRREIFCSKEALEKKEKGVRVEDKKLCKVFKQGPILCKKFDKNVKSLEHDTLSKETIKSFEKRAKVFCSSKPLHKKDLEVYQENQRLCNLFNDKILAYSKKIRNDELAYATLESYKKRASYFCARTEPKK